MGKNPSRMEFVNSPGRTLDDELRQMAEELPDEEWQTTAYLDFEDAVAAFEDGDATELAEFSNEMEARLDQAWALYTRDGVLSNEVAAESAVGHRLLKEGIASWRKAISQALSLEPKASQQRWDEVLAEAENGNRLLIAVQHLSRRLALER